MQPVNRITLVLRAKEGETLAHVLPYVQLGAPVAVGTSVAIIAGASDRDVLNSALDREDFCIDTRIKEVAAQLDPRDLFIKANPMGASDDELAKGRHGFVDDRIHGDWLIFKAGFEAALEGEQ
jgi:carbon storage regulator